MEVKSQPKTQKRKNPKHLPKKKKIVENTIVKSQIKIKVKKILIIIINE